VQEALDLKLVQLPPCSTPFGFRPTVGLSQKYKGSMNRNFKGPCVPVRESL
jgi:hypothetical protein